MTADVAEKINLLDLSANEFERFVVDILKQPRFRATQLIQWIHRDGVTDFDAMTNLSKALRAQLKEIACIRAPEVAYENKSADGTYKWLLRMSDGNCIETVLIPDKNRATLCVSSQVGCALNCSFCATGKQGFNRNLSIAEIIGQVWVAVRATSPDGLTKGRQITNIVMMGMGEPLLNYDAVLASMQFMLSDDAYNFSKYRVTLSTSGVVPQMQRLAKDIDVALAVSLHAPDDKLRNQLVPLNKKYPLDVLMPLCRDYFSEQKRRSVTFEYVMLDGVNDQLSHAKALAKLCRGISCKINLIPFNPFPKSNYRTSQPEVIDAFQNYMINAGFNTRVRRRRGDDIEAACGQLAGEFTDRTGRHQRWLKTGRLVPESTGSSSG